MSFVGRGKTGVETGRRLERQTKSSIQVSLMCILDIIVKIPGQSLGFKVDVMPGGKIRSHQQVDSMPVSR